jgi:hypothetical protein
MAILAQFEEPPTLEDLCFSSAWVGKSLEPAEFLAWWLDSWPALEYRAADRIAFTVPKLISV